MLPTCPPFNRSSVAQCNAFWGKKEGSKSNEMGVSIFALSEQLSWLWFMVIHNSAKSKNKIFNVDLLAWHMKAEGRLSDHSQH